jgi:hypothetical protein
VLGSCSQLMAHENREAAFTAQTLASVLMTHAAAVLPRPAASATSSSSNEVMIALWTQIEQSGVLQQLPGMLTSNLSALQSNCLADDKSPGVTLAPVRLSGQIFVQLQLLRGLQHLHSSLPTAHAASCAGQQFVVPAIHVCMSSVQHISTAYTQAG